MAYTPTTWKNGESPAINATNLNKIETALANCPTLTNNAVPIKQGGTGVSGLGYKEYTIKNPTIIEKQFCGCYMFGILNLVEAGILFHAEKLTESQRASSSLEIADLISNQHPAMPYFSGPLDGFGNGNGRLAVENNKLKIYFNSLESKIYGIHGQVLYFGEE